MRISQLLQRSLSYYWRTNLAVVLGVAAAVAVLAGALLVGDSVRASLRDLVVQRLGQTSHVVTSTGFVREQLAGEIQADPQFATNGFAATCPLISLQGTVTHESSKRVASGVKVYGVDDRFWTFNRQNLTAPQNRNTFISPALATELAVTTNDALVLQLEKPSDIPLESLHSKKDDLGRSVRLTVGNVIGAESLGEFSLQPQQSAVRAIFVPLKTLQRDLEQPDKVNTILVSEIRPTNEASLQNIVREKTTLADLGIKLRPIAVNNQPVISLEHESEMINDSLASAVQEAAKKSSLRAVGVLSYLANSISLKDKSIPYSLVTAIETEEFRSLSPNALPQTGPPPIILNEWAANDLSANKGDEITLEYYLWQEGGHLETKRSTFQIIDIVPIRGLAADRELVPEYPGITDSENLSDWDPPFPIDLKRIRQKDEDYWHQYRTTPKAFIPLNAGQALWQSRFGKMTSIRLVPATATSQPSAESLNRTLSDSLNPTLMGVALLPVRSEGLDASRGATDFGEYFLYFSFFLVISALLLTTLFFKLGIEQRVREIGSLRAMGFGPRKIRALFLIEGVILSLIGSLIGLIGAIGYGQFMMFGLRTWWVDAVGTNALKLHVSPQSIFIGATGGILAALVCVALTLRGLKRQSTRSLLAGSITNVQTDSKRRRLITSLRLAILFTVLGSVLLLAAAFNLIGQAAGFFGGGTLFLTALLCYQSDWLRRRKQRLLSAEGFWPIARAGFRNANYRPSRSVLCIALIASAVFIIVAVDSFRHREGATTLERKSGTGGFPLLAESVVPMVNDLNSREGQETLNLADASSEAALNGVTLTRFRVLPGDDASCLNLYQPRNPRIIAPTEDFLNSGRFVFQSSLASTPEELANPWLLLNRQFIDGAVPVIADANSLTYVLHLKLGQDFVMQHGDGELHLRVVGALADSLFQSEFLMSDKNFIRLFPNQQGYRFFLIDLPSIDRAPVVATTLEDRLVDYGLDVQTTSERLANFHRVENTYLSTFQMLGGLGLILGTIGLGAVLLRNVLERRRELALMRAVGYNSQHFAIMIVSENALLLFAGVVTGTVCALLAIMPVILGRHGQFINISLGLLLLAVLFSGLAASVAAMWAAIRTPLLQALRAE